MDKEVTCKNLIIKNQKLITVRVKKYQTLLPYENKKLLHNHSANSFGPCILQLFKCLF